MFGIQYFKADPMVYVFQYKNGVVTQKGPGLSFFYFAPTTSIVGVPLSTVDLPFAFQLLTRDFQTVTVQGQLSYRVTDPARLSALLNYTLSARGTYLSEDPSKLGDRLVNLAQTVANAAAQSMTLGQILAAASSLVGALLEKMGQSEIPAKHGIEILSLSILSIRPTPDMGKALEAEAREELQRQADQATFARRNAAVEEERKIKESELNTELAVEAKRRQIRESQMAADIALEAQKVQLLDQRILNQKKEADAQGYALAASLAPLKEMDWKTLTAVSNGGVDSKLMISLAFRELAEKAGKIGTLNVTPDLLQSLSRTTDAPGE